MQLNDAINKFSNWRKFKVHALTVTRYQSSLRMFCLYMKNPDIENIELNDVMKYINEMESLGWTRNGLSVVCLGLRKFFEFYNMQGYRVINENLIPLPRKEFKIPRIATVQSYQKLMGSIDASTNPHSMRNKALIGLTWDTGARIGEILSLNIDDLNLKDMKALIKTEKSRGRRPIREIFWSKSTNLHIKRWLKKREHLMKLFEFRHPDALFVSISKCAHYDVRGMRLTNRAASEIFRACSNRADIKPVNPHSMRHYMGRSIIEKNGSTADVANILGHSHLDSSMVYSMMFDKQLEKRYRHFRK